MRRSCVTSLARRPGRRPAGLAVAGMILVGLTTSLLTAGSGAASPGSPSDGAAQGKIVLRVDQPPQVGAAPGQDRTVRVSVQNVGDTALRDVQVTIRAGRGLVVRPRTIDLGSIDLYDRRGGRFTVRLAAGEPRRLTIRATASNASSRSRGLVVSPLSSPVPRTLVGSYQWATVNVPTSIWTNEGIYFATRKLAYVGFAPHGLPTCRRAGGSCVRYDYRPRSGKITVGRTKGTYRKGRLTLDGLSYAPLKVPGRGARWSATLVQLGLQGCAPSAPCLTFTHRLALDRDGTFAAKTTSIYTSRVARGSAAKQDTSYVRNGSGRYAVGRDGRLTLRYDGGDVVRKTIAIITDGRRRPDPYRAGLLIDSTNYYYKKDYYPGQG